MFVGREPELQTLEEACASETFEMVVVYGRRRVGKTTLLKQLAQDKRALFFTAQQQSDRDNLRDFCRAVALFFGLPEGTTFESWEAALSYLAARAAEEPYLLVFDEFPYAAAANRSIVSKLQIAIDHEFSTTRMCLVLCGSSQGFMESEVLGKKSPLHGRRTAQIRLRPLGYLEAAQMLPGLGAQQAFEYYACVGGVPYYLSLVDTVLPLRDNLARLFFSPQGLLYEEPQMLLRQELREPALYNSVLRAVGTGARRKTQIADRSGVGQASVSKYLKTLVDLDILERVVPFGESAQDSRKGSYRMRDAAYDFWYTFVMPAVGDVEEGLGAAVAAAIPDEVLATYCGQRFEEVCRQWMRGRALAGELPVPVTSVGSWWGGNPLTRGRDDIDVVAAGCFSGKVLLGECKWRESFDETEAFEKLRARGGLLRGYEPAGYYLFSKRPLSEGTLAKVASDPLLHAVTLQDMYAA